MALWRNLTSTADHCPRCGGQLYHERQLGKEVDVVCIRCGYRRYSGQPATAGKASKPRLQGR